ncbi:MAG TPA: sigma 54-interacting transcriptional regulator [Kofleriaceae bacterium]|nr:sigma 54-interacting transcriptional regulator [Kofleriaceae bacterium]
MASRTETLSRDDDPRPIGHGSHVPVLLLVLECERPAAGSARHDLTGIARVDLSRATERQVHRDGDVLELGVPDARMSEPHASMIRRNGRWIIEDAGSKNGIYLDGKRHERATLDDGAVIELGHTLFMFREQSARDLADPQELDRGLRTFVPELAQRFADLAAVATTSAAILIRGETGTGKELAARAAHASSGRQGPFVPINCGALPASLVESELFGYKRGAFSGAEQDRLGVVRSADHGTLFLDEIGDLPAASQAALLRVLQERQVTPLGATQAVSIDVQVVAATHHDLAARVEDGLFRRDLYARLAAFSLQLPPLRDRRDDLGLLIGALSPAGVRFSCAAVRTLLAYDWPLNIRELASCLTVSTALARGDLVRVSHLPPNVRDDVRDGPHLHELSTEDQAQRSDLVALLKEHAGNISAVARATGKARAQIHRWLRRFHLDPSTFR